MSEKFPIRVASVAPGGSSETNSLAREPSSSDYSRASFVNALPEIGARNLIKPMKNERLLRAGFIYHRYLSAGDTLRSRKLSKLCREVNWARGTSFNWLPEQLWQLFSEDPIISRKCIPAPRVCNFFLSFLSLSLSLLRSTNRIEGFFTHRLEWDKLPSVI